MRPPKAVAKAIGGRGLRSPPGKSHNDSSKADYSYPFEMYKHDSSCINKSHFPVLSEGLRPPHHIHIYPTSSNLRCTIHIKVLFKLSSIILIIRLRYKAVSRLVSQSNSSPKERCHTKVGMNPRRRLQPVLATFGRSATKIVIKGTDFYPLSALSGRTGVLGKVSSSCRVSCCLGYC